jgi:5'-3' exonuclease
LRYRCGFAADSQVKKDLREKNPGISDEELGVAIAQLDYTALALHNVKTVFETVLDRFNPEYKAYVQGKGNFRFDLATLKPYKGNRNAEHKPKYYQEIKDYLIERWNAIEVNGIESDDAIGIEQFDNPDKYTVIVSTDKDMNTIPGWHYNWVQDRLYYQSLNEANLFLFWQMLVGDTSDNIPGIHKIGEHRATKLLNDNDRDVEKVREAVKKLYQNQYGENWEKAYWEVGNLLYIRRKPGEECPLL